MYHIISIQLDREKKMQTDVTNEIKKTNLRILDGVAAVRLHQTELKMQTDRNGSCSYCDY